MERPNFRFLFLLKVVVPHVLMFSNLCPMFHRYISKWSRVVYLIKNILAVTCPISKKNKIFSNLTHDNLQCSNPFKPARVFLTFEASQLPTRDRLATRQKRSLATPTATGFYRCFFQKTPRRCTFCLTSSKRCTACAEEKSLRSTAWTPKLWKVHSFQGPQSLTTTNNAGKWCGKQV